MGQDEYVPQTHGIDDTSEETSITLLCQGRDWPFKFTFEALRHNLFRTTFTSDAHPFPPFPSAVRPGKHYGGNRPEVQASDVEKSFRFGELTVRVNWDSGPPNVSIQLEGTKEELHNDLPFRSYGVDLERRPLL